MAHTKTNSYQTSSSCHKRYNIYLSYANQIDKDTNFHKLTLEKSHLNFKFLLVSIQRIFQSAIFDKKINKIEFFTVFDEKIAVGYIYLSDINSYRTPFLPLEGKEITIIIHPTYRRLGYAKNILLIMKDKPHQVFALVRENNIASNILFKSLFTFKCFANQLSGFLGNRYFYENNESQCHNSIS